MNIELYMDIAGALFLLFFMVGAFQGLSMKKLWIGLFLSLIWPAIPPVSLVIAAWDIDT